MAVAYMRVYYCKYQTQYHTCINYTGQTENGEQTQSHLIPAISVWLWLIYYYYFIMNVIDLWYMSCRKSVWQLQLSIVITWQLDHLHHQYVSQLYQTQTMQTVSRWRWRVRLLFLLLVEVLQSHHCCWAAIYLHSLYVLNLIAGIVWSGLDWVTM